METKVLSTGVRHSTSPESYVRPESERPRLSEVSQLKNAPIIDLGCEERARIGRDFDDALKNYGFYQVPNHGIPLELVNKMLGVAHAFFMLPLEDKLKLYSDDPAKTTRLSTSFNVNKEIDKYEPQWPSNPPHFKITTGHAIYALQTGALMSLMQIKYHDSSPYDTHYDLMLLFVAALLLYCAASFSEAELCARRSIYQPVATYSRLLGYSISLVVCIFILELVVLGWIIFFMWVAFFTKVAYDRLCLHNCLLNFGGFITSKWNNFVENPVRPTEDPVLSQP